MGLGGMIERQRRKHVVVQLILEIDDGTLILRQKRCMSHHGALGCGRSPGCIQNLRRRRWRTRRSRTPPSTRSSQPKKNVAPAVSDERHEKFYQAGSSYIFEILFERQIVHRRPRARLPDDIGEFCRCQRVVDGNMDQSCPGASEPGQQICVGVSTVSRYAVTGPQSESGEATRDPARSNVQIGKGPSTFAIGQSGLAGVAPRRSSKRVANRIATRAIDVFHGFLPFHCWRSRERSDSVLAFGEVQRDVDDHVFLSTHHAPFAEFHQDGACIDAVEPRGGLRMSQETRIDTGKPE